MARLALRIQNLALSTCDGPAPGHVWRQPDKMRTVCAARQDVDNNNYYDDDNEHKTAMQQHIQPSAEPCALEQLGADASRPCLASFPIKAKTPHG